MTSEELKRLVAEANERYEKLTQEQKAEMWEVQRRSWVRGEMMLEHPEMTKEEADRLYDKVSLG